MAGTALRDSADHRNPLSLHLCIRYLLSSRCIPPITYVAVLEIVLVATATATPVGNGNTLHYSDLFPVVPVPPYPTGRYSSLEMELEPVGLQLLLAQRYHYLEQ